MNRKLLAQLRERAGKRCEKCGRGVTEIEALSPHHIQRRSQGGKDTPENLQMICYACHLKEHGVKEVRA